MVIDDGYHPQDAHHHLRGNQTSWFTHLNYMASACVMPAAFAYSVFGNHSASTIAQVAASIGVMLTSSPA